MHALLYSVPPILQQATATPHLHQRLLDNDGQVWVSLKKAREFQKNIYFCFIDYAKAFDCVDHNKLWKILQEIGIPDLLTCLLRFCIQVKKQQLELDMEQQTGSKFEKG